MHLFALLALMFLVISTFYMNKNCIDVVLLELLCFYADVPMSQ